MSATAFQRLRRERIAKMREEAEKSMSKIDEEKALTNKEIKAILDEKGIEYDSKANKETLLKLLEGAE